MSVWIDDGQNQAGNDPWYGQQQQSGYGYSQQGGADLGWNTFDYSQPSQPSAPQQTSGYYGQQPSGYGQSSQDYYSGNMFIPQANGGVSSGGGGEDFENEPPLLEELGINFSHIREKTIAVLNPVGSTSAEIIADQDLAGPLVFCLLFGGALLLHGKLQFGYIYGIGGLGCVGIYALLNLMSANSSISFTCAASVLGYCLLPMALLSMIAAVFSFQGFIGYIISSLAVLWCSASSSKLFVIALEMHGQRLLVAYPCMLLYSVFALLAIF